MASLRVWPASHPDLVKTHFQFGLLVVTTLLVGYVDPYVAFCIGIIGGIGSYVSAKMIKKLLGIDDVLDVTSLQVHAVA